MNNADRAIELHRILKKYWGYDEFRPLQLDIINSILDGHDTIGLMPTGGGKSITFQVPGMYLDGLTIVITPLVSLMKDQVDALRKRRIKAVNLYSGMTSSEIRYTWDLIVNGKAKFLYCSPERLRNQRFLKELEQLNISRIVVDESHCISQWGYDFRPDYLNIPILRKIAPDAPILALTATATPEVVDDIADKTGMRAPRIFRKSFSRDNLSYIVRATEDKTEEMRHILSRTQGSAIVYVRSRRRAMELAKYLTEHDISALPYHAGLDRLVKADNQNRWIADDVRVMVATNAFGMGIDKPDVRVVIHHDMPSSLEEYYQEAGRAGRDGLESYAVLLSNIHDKRTLHRRLTQSFPPRPDIKKVYELVCTFLNVSVGEGYDKLYEFELPTFCKRFDYDEGFVRASLQILTRSQLMHFLEEIDMRTRVMITVPREALYHIEGVSPNAERVLTKVLRLYTGLFSDYAYINEIEIGIELGVDTRVVYEALIELSRARIISYIPRRRVPYIYFPTAREETRHIKIPKTVYEDRKRQMERRIEAMLDYAFTGTSCRVQRVLKYFGQHEAPACGKCDVCRRERPKPQPISSEKVQEYLLQVISTRAAGYPIREIGRLPGIRRDDLMTAIRELVLDNRIKVQGTCYKVCGD